MSEVWKSCTYSSQMRLLGETPYICSIVATLKSMMYKIWHRLEVDSTVNSWVFQLWIGLDDHYLVSYLVLLILIQCSTDHYQTSARSSKMWFLILQKNIWSKKPKKIYFPKFVSFNIIPRSTKVYWMQQYPRQFYPEVILPMISWVQL